MKNTRNISLDIIRIIAILFVAMIHVSAFFVINFDKSSIEFFTGNIFDSISRIAVPLFLMLSGALILNNDKNFELKNILKKILNIFVLTIIWSIIYSLLYDVILNIVKNRPINIKDIIISIGSGHYHMWYLYMIIGLYLVTPFLKQIIKEKNYNLIYLFILLSIFFQFLIPIINEISLVCHPAKYIIKFIDKFELGFFNGFISYYLIGWLITNKDIKNKYKNRLYIIGLISLLIVIIRVQFTGNYKYLYNTRNILLFFYAISMFLALYTKDTFNISEKAKNFISSLSKLTFGVYIIHPLILDIILKVFVYKNFPVFYILIVHFLVILISFIITYIMSKIPVIKKLVRF